jgi:hypothetical protein
MAPVAVAEESKACTVFARSEAHDNVRIVIGKNIENKHRLSSSDV